MKLIPFLQSLLGLIAASSMASSSFAEPLGSRGGQESLERGADARGAFAVRQPGSNERAHGAAGGCGDCTRPPPRERMTSEERRQLRHDINEAGRDLYRRHDLGGHP